MDCATCGGTGTTRIEIQFRNNSRFKLYMCENCIEQSASDERVKSLAHA